MKELIKRHYEATRKRGLITDETKVEEFMMKLNENPAKHAVQELYEWMHKASMPITENGNFLAYKKFQDDNVYGYNTQVSRYWHVYNDADGNVIYYTGKEGPEVGAKVLATATVKKHLVSKKGDKVTVLFRPRFKLVEPEVETEGL